MLVTIERDGPVAVATLNRPAAMNALSGALCAELAATIDALDADEAVRVVVLTGAGERAFSAGVDLKELGAGTRTLGTSDVPNPVAAVERCRKPVIGAINGVAVTGGFELALACDFLIAAATARFADTHVRVGIMPGWGLSQKLSRLIGIGRAKELAFSGNFLDAQTARDWGLVNRVVAPAELLPTALRLAHDIAGADPSFVQAYKGLIDEGYAQSLGEALKLEQRHALGINAQIDPAEVEARRAAVLARGRGQVR